MDPAITGAWIGFGGGIVASLGGAVVGHRITVLSERRKDRQAAAAELADLGRNLSSDHGFGDVTHAVDKLAVSLAGAGISSDVISALRTIAVRCNKASVQFAQRNPKAGPVMIEETTAQPYTALVDALTQELQHNGRKSARQQRLDAAVTVISQLPAPA